MLHTLGSGNIRVLRGSYASRAFDEQLQYVFALKHVNVYALRKPYNVNLAL